MEIWKDIVLIASILCVFAFGYFVTGRLDRIIDENRKAIAKEDEVKAPTCIMLAEDMTDEEITDEIRRFRKDHKSSRMVLYDGPGAKYSEKIERHADLKG